MPSADIVVSCPVHDSFRVQQVAGMFDVPLSENSSERFQVELPEVDQSWQVGLIVGPSGSGKSTVAKQFYADELYQPSSWPNDKAVIDCFGDLPVKHVVELFTAVGFSSPPAWVKPYQVLSCGEQFRCDLAKALSRGFRLETLDSRSIQSSSLKPNTPSLLVFDEFTSVVDRNVAKACSTAIAKGIRRGCILCRFIAVTCHYDVAEWLEADWVLDMAASKLTRRRLRRPDIQLEIHRSRLAAWPLFARHHYLNGNLAPPSRCYLATWQDEPVAFCATLPVITRKNHRRFTRIVTLPDYQGMGIGMRVVEAVASLHREEGHRVNVTSSHPGLIRHCRNSELWKAVNVKKSGTTSGPPALYQKYRGALGRAVVSFEYVGT